jgi:putative membrane protein
MKRWLSVWMALWWVAGGILAAAAGEMAAPPADYRIMAAALSWTSLVTSVVYGFLGLILLLIGYYIYELITPWSVKEELIAHRNPAVAMVVAAFILGMAIVIAAAII